MQRPRQQPSLDLTMESRKSKATSAVLNRLASGATASKAWAAMVKNAKSAVRASRTLGFKTCE